jgi:hypothetical protein
MLVVFHIVYCIKLLQYLGGQRHAKISRSELQNTPFKTLRLVVLCFCRLPLIAFIAPHIHRCSLLLLVCIALRCSLALAVVAAVTLLPCLLL